eukprot:8581711-Alexandrium_andersonii.AAC.1
MDPTEVAERTRKARLHLEFVVKLYVSQLERGARFLHEHPTSAASWNEESIKDLMARPGVECGIGHMCRFGVTAPAVASAGSEPAFAGVGCLPVRKPTRWMSSSPEILKR